MNPVTRPGTPFDWSASPIDQTPGDPRKLKEAAQQFEALLIGQMLASMRSSDNAGWLGEGQDSAGSTMTELAEQCVAQSIAASGGFGLATLIERGLTQSVAAERRQEAPTAAPVYPHTASAGLPSAHTSPSVVPNRSVRARE